MNSLYQWYKNHGAIIIAVAGVAYVAIKASLGNGTFDDVILAIVAILHPTTKSLGSSKPST